MLNITICRISVPIAIHYTYMFNVVKMTRQILVLSTNNSQKEGASDVNGDGETSVADLTALVYLLLNKQ